MKKLYFLIVLVCLFSIQSLDAQFGKGSVLAGVTSSIGLGDFGTSVMSAGFVSEKYKDDSGESSDADKGFAFNLLPRAGYFVIDNLAVGLDLAVGLYSQKQDDGDKYSETTLAIGPFVRYYYPLEKIYPFVEANVGFGTWKEKTESYDNKEGIFLFGAGLGAALPVADNIMVDAILGYGSQSWKDEDNDKYIYGSVGLRIGFTLVFGPKE